MDLEELKNEIKKSAEKIKDGKIIIEIEENKIKNIKKIKEQ